MQWLSINLTQNGEINILGEIDARGTKRVDFPCFSLREKFIASIRLEKNNSLIMLFETLG